DLTRPARRPEFLRGLSVRGGLRRDPGAHAQSHARADHGGAAALRQSHRRWARSDAHRRVHRLSVSRPAGVSACVVACRRTHAACSGRAASGATSDLWSDYMKISRVVSAAVAASLCVASVHAAENAGVEQLISSMTIEEKIDLIGGTGFATRAI